MATRKFRWTVNGGASWNYEEFQTEKILNISALNTVTVEPIGAALTNNGLGTVLSQPAGFGWTVPFVLATYQNQYLTDFFIESYRPTTSVTYYVDPVSGLDANDGLTTGSPKQNFSSAITAANTAGLSAKFLLKPGVYRFVRGWNNTALNVSAIIEPWATDPTDPNNVVKLVSRSSAAALTWTADTGETYTRSSITSDPVHIVDLSFKDIYGSFLRYSKASDLANCRATRGTWWRDNATSILYVHSADGRNLVGDVNIDQPSTADQGQWTPSTNNAVLWMQNIAFFGGGSACILLKPATGVSATAYAKNCIFECSASGNGWGAAAINANSNIDTYLFGCIASWNTSDGFNYHANGTNATGHFVEINCITGPNGYDTSGINNATTGHESVRGFRLNGNYAGSQNRTLNDINATQSWNVNCTFGPSQATDGTGITVVAGSTDSGMTARIWLDHCTIGDSFNGELYAFTGCTINYRDMNITGLVTGGSGTIAPY